MTGRTPPPIPTVTTSTGVTLPIARYSPLLILDLMRAFPPPAPPLAPGVGGELEPNPADPDHQRALAAHQQELQLRINDALLDFGIGDDVAIDPARLARARAKAARHGMQTTGDDRLDYIRLVAIGGPGDLQLILTAIRTYTSPSEEAIGAAEAAFRGDVGGAAGGSGGAGAAAEPGAVPGGA